jgi:hypothetical protein
VCLPLAADRYFQRAGECFRKSVDLDPKNDSYRRALEMSTKAPQLYQELQRQLQVHSAQGGSPGATSPRAAPSKQVGALGLRVRGCVCKLLGRGRKLGFGGVEKLVRSSERLAGLLCCSRVGDACRSAAVAQGGQHLFCTICLQGAAGSVSLQVLSLLPLPRVRSPHGCRSHLSATFGLMSAAGCACWALCLEWRPCLAPTLSARHPRSEGPGLQLKHRLFESQPRELPLQAMAGLLAQHSAACLLQAISVAL